MILFVAYLSTDAPRLYFVSYTIKITQYVEYFIFPGYFLVTLIQYGRYLSPGVF